MESEEELTPLAGMARFCQITVLCRVAQHIRLVPNHKPKEITWNPKESSHGPPSILIRTVSFSLQQPHCPQWRLLCYGEER